MRNAYVVRGWKLTPAICRSTYDTGTEVMTVSQVNRGKDGEGYHLEAPNGTTYFVQRWEDNRKWTSQKLTGNAPSFFLHNPSNTLSSLLETLRLQAASRNWIGPSL